MEKAINYKEVLHITWQCIYKAVHAKTKNKKNVVNAILKYSKAEGGLRRELHSYKNIKPMELRGWINDVTKEIDKALLIYAGPGAKLMQSILAKSVSSKKKWFIALGHFRESGITLTFDQIIQAFYHHLIHFKDALLMEVKQDDEEEQVRKKIKIYPKQLFLYLYKRDGKLKEHAHKAIVVKALNQKQNTIDTVYRMVENFVANNGKLEPGETKTFENYIETLNDHEIDSHIKALLKKVN